MNERARTWPRGVPLDPETAIDVRCASCGTHWQVHENLAGYRFRCEECTAWIEVPRPEQATPLQLEMGRALARSEAGVDEARVDTALVPVKDMPVDERGLRRVELPVGRVYEGDIPPSEAMAPGAVRNVRNEVRKRWTTRASLEIAGMLISILLPHLLLLIYATEGQQIVLAPLAAMVGGIGVILVGMSAPQYTFGGLRNAPAWGWGLGVLGAIGALGLAYGWLEIVQLSGIDTDLGEGLRSMTDTIGVAGLLVVWALSPALFEELAFRGLLQGRLMALMGRIPGLLSTAMLFAAAHGISLGTPLHVAIGLYLGWLRDRCNSLWPGILLHFAYNGTLVLAEVL